jgi:hypothetical protein
MKTAADFLATNPTLLSIAGPFQLWEHPTRGDTAPVIMTTPCGRVISTGFYDLGDLDEETCLEILANAPPRIRLTTPGEEKTPGWIARIRVGLGDK